MTNPKSEPHLDGITIDPRFELAQRIGATLGTSVDAFARRVYLIGEINEEAMYRFITSFQVLDSTLGQISITLASPGGAEAAGWGIYDAIKLAANPVTIDGFGGVFSIAACIFQAATTRRLAPQSRFMIHNGSVLIDGGLGANEAIGMGEEVKRNNSRYHKILQARSNLTFDEVSDMCRDETFLSAEEAVKYGFADEIISYRPAKKIGKGKKKK